jgi:hypothetical protein
VALISETPWDSPDCVHVSVQLRKPSKWARERSPDRGLNAKMAEITALSENACVFRAITVTGLSPFSSSRLIGAILFSRDKGDKAALSAGKSSRTLSSSEPCHSFSTRKFAPDCVRSWCFLRLFDILCDLIECPTNNKFWQNTDCINRKFATIEARSERWTLCW